jgi:hypothetical protein
MTKGGLPVGQPSDSGLQAVGRKMAAAPVGHRGRDSQHRRFRTGIALHPQFTAGRRRLTVNCVQSILQSGHVARTCKSHMNEIFI